MKLSFEPTVISALHKKSCRLTESFIMCPLRVVDFVNYAPLFNSLAPVYETFYIVILDKQLELTEGDHPATYSK